MNLGLSGRPDAGGPDVSEPQVRRGATWMLVLGLGLIGLLWILAAPQSAGPDEPSHVTRAAALVRGQFEGDPPTDAFGQVSYQLPGWIGEPSPACYAFQPTVPASCAAETEPPEGIVTVNSRSASYQFWPFVLPGLGTLLPEAFGSYPARVMDAVVPVALLAFSLLISVRRGWVAAGGVLLAATPMAWFSFATVNPSGLAIAGGIALWVGQDACRRAPTTAHRWLVAAGWAALALSRRDGLIWAFVILVVTCLAGRDGFADWWRRLGLGPQLVVGLSTAATMVWAFRQDDTTSRMLLLAPVVPLVAIAGRRGFVAVRGAPSRVRWTTAAAAATAAALGGIALAVLIDDRSRFITEMSATGLHLTEAIGLLGWLDTPVPTVALYAWLVGLGALIGAALGVGWESIVAAFSTLIAGIAAAWFLEYFRDDPIGTWQGRYYLPLLVGVPILVSQTDVQRASRRVGQLVVGTALCVGLVSFAASLRRWGVGIDGATAPWTWDTYDSPLPPVVLLGGFIVVSAMLWIAVSRLTVDRPVLTTDAPDSPVDSDLRRP